MDTKVLIFSAPSGSGKTTLVRHLLAFEDLKLEFSVSACSRAPRGEEIHGKDYYFLSVEDFKQKIENDDFLEWEEVYKDNFYGSLKSEVNRIANKGNNAVFDVDVIGGLNIKKFYGNAALSVFIMPPSVEELEKRLKNRSTDNESAIKTRIEKAKFEMQFAQEFDVIIINDKLENAKSEVEKIVRDFFGERSNNF
jgi:guanylate kinase